MKQHAPTNACSVLKGRQWKPHVTPLNIPLNRNYSCPLVATHLKLIIFPDEEFDDVEDKATYKAMLTRDERRFKTADRDRDGIATREEFTAFLHPEEFDYMKDVVVQVELTTSNFEKVFFVDVVAVVV